MPSNPDHSLNTRLGRSRVIQLCTLAGYRHHAAPSLLQALKPTTALQLQREPDNPHDPEAVALCWRGVKLGYLPRTENFVAARLLDSERQLCARVHHVDRSADSNHRISLEVLLF